MRARNSTNRIPHENIAEKLRTGQPFRRSIDRWILFHSLDAVLGCFFVFGASTLLINADLSHYLQPRLVAILGPLIKWGIPVFLAFMMIREIFNTVIWARSRVAVGSDRVEIYEWYGRTRTIDFSEILALTAFTKLIKGESVPSGYWSLWVCHKKLFTDEKPRWSHLFSGKKKNANLIRDHLLEYIELPTETKSTPHELAWHTWRRQDIDDLPTLKT